MKKFLLTLLLLVSLGMAAKAAEVTFNDMTHNGATKDGVTYTYNKGDGTSNTQYDNPLRIYIKNIITFTSSDKITKIVFTASETKYAGSTLYVSADGTVLSNAVSKSGTTVTVTIPAGANKVEITNGKTGDTNIQLRISKTVVTTEVSSGGESDKPTISAATGSTVYTTVGDNTVAAGTEVTFTVTNCEDANITAAVGTDSVDFVNGEYTATITENTEVTIEATYGQNNKVEATYNFIVGAQGGNDPAPAGNSYTIVFGDSNNDETNDIKPEALASYITEGVEYYAEATDINKVYKGINGLKFSSGKVNGAITINLSEAGKVKSNKIIVKACSWTNTQGTVDSGELAVNGATAQSLTKDLADYTFEFNETLLESIKLEATKRIYVKSITVVAVGAESEPTIDTITLGDVKHGAAMGRVSAEYYFVVKNHNGVDPEVTMNVYVGGQKIESTIVEEPSAQNAPMLAASQANSTFQGTITHEHNDLKGAKNVEVEITAKLGDKVLATSDKKAPTVTTGIEDVMVDGEGEAEYYTLEGLRVSEPQAGQLYIKRQGGKATKVLVK